MAQTDTPPKMQGIRSIQTNDQTHAVIGPIGTLGHVEKWYVRDEVNDGKKQFRAIPLGHKWDARDFDRYGQASEFLVDYWRDINLRTYPHGTGE